MKNVIILAVVLVIIWCAGCALLNADIPAQRVGELAHPINAIRQFFAILGA